MFKQFRDTDLTNKGFSVSNASASGKAQYQITRAVSTATDISRYKTEDVKNLTSLPNQIDSGTITDYHSQDDKDNVSIIRINFDNSNFKDGYEIRAVGLYAKLVNSDKEFLHSVTITDSVVTIPAVSGNVYDGFDLDMAVFTGSNKNITVNIADENTATVKYVNEAIANLNMDKVVADINNNIATTKANLDKRVANLEKNDMKFMGYINNGDDLDKLPNVAGFWVMDGIDISKVHGYPDILKYYNNGMAWGYVIQDGSHWLKQEMCNVTANDDDVIAYRIYENSWHYWKIYASTDYVNSAVSKAKDALNNDINNRVDWFTYNSNVKGIQNQINNKVNQADYKDKVDDLQGQINNTNGQLQSDINSRVDWSTYKQGTSNLQDQINSRVSSDSFNTNVSDLKSRINNLVDNSLNYRGTLQDGDDLNNLINSPDGYHDCYNSNVKNMPIDYTAWFVVITYDRGSFKFMEYFDNWGNRFYRVASGSPNVWGEWRELANIDSVKTIVGKLRDDLQGQINSRVDWNSYNNKVDDFQNRINSRVDWNSYNNKVDDFQNQINARVNNDIFYSKVNDLQQQVYDRVSQSEYKPKMGDLQSQINARVNNDIFYSNINRLQGNLDNAVNQINANIQKIADDSLQFRGDAPNPLSDAKAPGIYIMPGNVNYSDAPNDSNRGQMIVLATGNLTNQMVINNHGDVSNRSIGGNGTTSWK